MKALYSLSTLDRADPVHIGSPDGKHTLCGEPLQIFGEPLAEGYARMHMPCKLCARVDTLAKKQIQAWEEAVS
jgi:hypothetical protein